MGELKHGGRLVESRDNTKHVELHWEGVTVGSGFALCGLVSSNWSWKSLSGPTSLPHPLQQWHPTDESLRPPRCRTSPPTGRDNNLSGFP